MADAKWHDPEHDMESTVVHAHIRRENTNSGCETGEWKCLLRMRTSRKNLHYELFRGRLKWKIPCTVTKIIVCNTCERAFPTRIWIYTWVKFNTWELIPDITDYKLGFVTQKFQTTDPIWRTKIIKNKYLNEIQYTEVFTVADAKTIKYKNTTKFWSGKITEFLR